MASRITFGLFPALLLATLVAYYPALHGGLLWDDDKHLVDAALGSIGGLYRIWFDHGATQQYYPLTYTVFWVENRLWASNTLGYHIVNVVLHTVSACLVAASMRKLAIPGAALAAVIFALHPVHVESVAWMSELKNTLSTVCVLASLLVYLRFDEARRTRLYVSAFFLFLLALLSKSVTATLPAALLVVAWSRRGTIEGRRDVRPLIPFFVCGAVAAAHTAWFERTIVGASGAEFQLSIVERCLLAGRVILFYLGALFWPSNLIFNYPRWEVSQGVWWHYLFPFAAIGLAGGCWMLRRRSRGPFASMALFCVLLAPVLGFLNVYPFVFSFVADHFVYLPSIPVIVLVAAALTAGARRWRLTAVAASGGALALAAVLGLLTFLQSRNYVDADTLYRHVLERNPLSWIAHNNLGALQVETGRTDEALAHLEAAIRLAPEVPRLHNVRGIALQQMGRIEEAVPAYREAVRLDPNFAWAYSNLGNALLVLGRLEESAGASREALRLKPDDEAAHYNLGLALLAFGRPEAGDQFRALLTLRPDLAEAHNYLGTALERDGRSDEALAHYQEAFRLKPELVEARLSLGSLLQEKGRFGEAEDHYRAVLGLRPDSPVAHNNLGTVLIRTGRTDEALAHLREAVRLKPDYVDARFNLANVLGNTGRIEESILHYREVVKYQPADAVAHQNLGLALQARGRTAEAAAEFREASRLKAMWQKTQ